MRHEGIESTMAWFAMRRHFQEAALCHENVYWFPQEWFRTLLSDLYDVAPERTVMELKSFKLGWADKRGRTFRCLPHRAKVVEILQPFAAVAALFERVCKITWRDYFVMDEQDPELQAELLRASARPEVGPKRLSGLYS